MLRLGRLGPGWRPSDAGAAVCRVVARDTLGLVGVRDAVGGGDVGVRATVGGGTVGVRATLGLVGVREVFVGGMVGVRATLGLVGVRDTFAAGSGPSACRPCPCASPAAPSACRRCPCASPAAPSESSRWSCVTAAAPSACHPCASLAAPSVSREPAPTDRSQLARAAGGERVDHRTIVGRRSRRRFDLAIRAFARNI